MPPRDEVKFTIKKDVLESMVPAVRAILAAELSPPAGADNVKALCELDYTDADIRADNSRGPMGPLHTLRAPGPSRDPLIKTHGEPSGDP